MTNFGVSAGFVALLAGAVALGSAAHAQSVKLTGEEIETLLSGNTAHGLWDGAPYRQYFGPDGVTIYAQDGARSARGEWRVDHARDEFQSLWPSDEDWQGWFVALYLGEYYWLSKTTPPTLFKVDAGQQLIEAQ